MSGMKVDVKIRMHLVVSHQTETGGKLKTRITHCRWRSVNVAWLKRYPPDKVWAEGESEE